MNDDISDILNNGMFEDYTDMTQILDDPRADISNQGTRSVSTQTDNVLILGMLSTTRHRELQNIYRQLHRYFDHHSTPN